MMMSFVMSLLILLAMAVIRKKQKNAREYGSQQQLPK